MKKSVIYRLFRASVAVALAATIGTSVSCMTTYDPYGRPMQTVDPGVAVAGAVAAGLIGYSLANDHGYYDRGYYGGPCHRGYRY